MESWFYTNEPVLRLAVFFAILGAVAMAEAVWPRRPRSYPRWRRWPSNLAIVMVDGLAVRLLAPLLPVAMAFWAAEHQFGLAHWAAPGLPLWLVALVSFLLLDLAIWGQHVATHKVPMLWRLHRMHHADLDYDVTTGLRFHPVEILLSVVWKLAVIAVLGAPAWVVIAFEITLNATAMFNHGNLRLPQGLDRWLRLVVVTPDMHRVHHSIHRDETDSNYGFNLPWWDRLFGTYRAQPRDGHTAMTIGLDLFREADDLRLDRMLLQPLRQDTNAANEVTPTR